MTSHIAALPMYDWPERRAEVDAQWAAIRDRLRAGGVDAPETLVRRNADLPAVPGGIRDASGALVAPDPATLPPDKLDYPTLWRHPALLFAQTCWGPMRMTGLERLVAVVAQPSYDGIEGGEGTSYSSALVMRAAEASQASVPAPDGGHAIMPLALLRGTRLAFNDPHSMSGLLGLESDLAAAGETLSLFSSRVESGGHRLSIRMVADGRADVAAIDCLSWHLARLHEPAAAGLVVVGWTKRREGLPFIASRHMPAEVLDQFREALRDATPAKVR